MHLHSLIIKTSDKTTHRVGIYFCTLKNYEYNIVLIK